MQLKSPLIQVAGVRDLREAELICSTDVNMLGFPLRLDFHTPDCSEATAAGIISALPPTVLPVAICYCSTAQEVDDLLNTLQINAVQLHGKIAPAEIDKLRTLRPEVYLIKSLVVGQQENDQTLIQIIRDTETNVDCYITDTYDPASGASGATGKTHDWGISAQLRQISPRPLILAGGLTPSNVAEAIQLVRPAGVDVHTGVEGKNGRKDPRLLERFVAESLRAFAALNES